MSDPQPTPQSSVHSEGGLRDELEQDMQKLKNAGQKKAGEKAETGKQAFIQAAKSTSAALKTAAGAVTDDSAAPGWLASGLEQAAGRLEGMAEAADGKNVGQIGQQAVRFARENPGAFVAASAAAGFAAARFFRAGFDHRSTRDAHHDQPADPFPLSEHQDTVPRDATRGLVTPFSGHTP